LRESIFSAQSTLRPAPNVCVEYYQGSTQPPVLLLWIEGTILTPLPLTPSFVGWRGVKYITVFGLLFVWPFFSHFLSIYRIEQQHSQIILSLFSQYHQYG